MYFVLIIFIMESIIVHKIASRGWHVYGKTTWKKPFKGQKVFAMKAENKEALESDPCAVAWKIRFHDKVMPQTVGHVPREISRPIYYFLTYGGEVCGEVADEKYRPSPIPKGGLEIALTVTCKISATKQDILQRLDSMIKENYDESFLEGVVGLEEFSDAERGEEESVEGDFLIDDENDNDVICLD